MTPRHDRAAHIAAVCLIVAAIIVIWVILAARLGAQSSGSTHYLTVPWTYVQGTDTATGFYVLRSATSGGPYGVQNNLNPLPVTQLQYVDTGCPSGTTCYYVIQAVDAAGNLSAYSNEVSGTMPANPTPPTADKVVAR